MINHETQLEYANTDPSLHCNRIEPAPEMTWQRVWIYLLLMKDEAAQIVFDANMQSLECEFGDHDYCRSDRCSCVHHRAMSFPVQGAALKSCAEMASEDVEAA